MNKTSRLGMPKVGGQQSELKEEKEKQGTAVFNHDLCNKAYLLENRLFGFKIVIFLNFFC